MADPAVEAPTPIAAEPARANESLVSRLVRSATLWALPSLIVTALALTWFYRNSTYRIYDDPLISAVTTLIASANVVAPGTGDAQLQLMREPTDPRYQQALSGRYWLVGTLDESGEISAIKTSRSLLDDTLRLPARDAALLINAPGEDIVSKTTGPDNEPLRVAARYVILPNMDSQPVVVLAAVDSRPATQAVQRFAGLAVFLMSLLTLGLVTAVFTQVRLGLKPLFDLRDSVVAVREGRTDRVDGHYPKEIAPLATELNTLIGHNKDVVERAQTHVSNLAHALKTPLAVLRNESHLQPKSDTDAGAGFAGVVDRQTEIMRNQVEHHLRRARAAARGQAIGVVTDVAETLGSLARTLPRIYRSKDIDISVSVDPDLAFRGEKRDLEEMAGNLMDNACKWTTSRVRVSAKVTEDDDASFHICVEDDGPGLDGADYGAALKRGVRLDEATPGTGFGLAIVDDLSRAYKGGVDLARSDMGGLKVTLTLPCRPMPPKD